MVWHGMGIAWYDRGMALHGRGMVWHGIVGVLHGRCMTWHGRGMGGMVCHGKGMAWHGYCMTWHGRGMACCCCCYVCALRTQLPAGVMSGRSVILSTLFLGKLPEAGYQYLAPIL